MTKLKNLHVAVPWALSHYIPLNGHHPLYRALFDEAPAEINLHAWDNVKLYEELSRNLKLREKLIAAMKEKEKKSTKTDSQELTKNWSDYFWAPNQILTALLKGDIEFHHTAPYPSFERPFVFHCESFAPVFLPFAEQGGGKFKNKDVLKAHYGAILAHPLCLGIFSHIPETLKSLSLFFDNAEIDRKLFPSRIGLGSTALADTLPSQDMSLSRPTFLFINSANQNPTNFFRRGGHIVLRFWETFRKSGRNGMLMLRCAKPSKTDLIANGVNVDFLESETCSSVLWIEEYLANHEQNALMARANFLLLPSASLHSVSIMQSMLLGAIPVVTDTVGTDRYVTDGESGIVLEGMKAANWYVDPEAGILMDRYSRNPQLDYSLVQQLTSRIAVFLDDQYSYAALREKTLAHAREEFSAKKFSTDFWHKVVEVCEANTSSIARGVNRLSDVSKPLRACILLPQDLPRIFESCTQPMQRINTGESVVWEVGGAMIHATGPNSDIHDWSPMAQYYKQWGFKATFANTLPELGEKYLPVPEKFERSTGNKLISQISHMLQPFPELHSFGSYALKKSRGFLRYVDFHFLNSNSEPDIELALHGICGYNVIRYFHKYYAIPQHEGQFSIGRIRAREYSSFFVGNSVEAIIRQIPVVEENENPDPSVYDEECISLACEGFRGFNVVQRGSQFHAILQNEGAFIFSKIAAKEYSQSYSGASLGEVLKQILDASEVPCK